MLEMASAVASGAVTVDLNKDNGEGKSFVESIKALMESIIMQNHCFYGKYGLIM